MKRQPNWHGHVVAIDNVEAAELALLELASVVAAHDAVKAKFDAKLREVNEAARKAAEVTIDGAETSLHERERLLEATLLTWADEHREELCANGKTARLRNGVFSWRFKGACVVVDDAKDSGDIIAKIWQINGLRQTVNAVLEKCLNAFGAVTLQLKLDRTAAKKAYDGGNLDAAALKRLGLRYQDRIEYVSVELSDIRKDGHEQTLDA